MKRIIFLCFAFFLMFHTAAKAQTDVIHAVFLTLEQDYINTISKKEIALYGLKALTDIDENLNFNEENNILILTHSNKIFKKIEFPPEEADIKTWALWCQSIFKTAEKVSQQVSVHDFEMPDKFAQNVFEHTDGYSNYFSTFTDNFDKDNAPKVHRSFTSRVIDDFLLIRVLNFQNGVTKKIKTAVTECSKCKGLILDLRGNHGGILNEALSTANLFLDEGIIAYTSNNRDAPQFFTAEKGDILEGKPMVILADGLSASASEILTGALTDQNRATFIGTQTYGKGTVQNVKKMDEDRAMATTVSYFYTPSGIKIDKVGLTPQICTGSHEDCAKEDRFKFEEDIQRAVQYLKTGI